LHSVDCFIFVQPLVVWSLALSWDKKEIGHTLADGDEEDESGNRVKDVEPFTSISQLGDTNVGNGSSLPLGSLTSNVEQLVRQFSNSEVGFAIRQLGWSDRIRLAHVIPVVLTRALKISWSVGI
jgi:hypothetical protein